MNYFSRIFAPDVFQPCAKDFDQRVFETFSSKLALPPLNDVAREQVSLPVFLGGFGLRSMSYVSPVAYWCALSQYYHLISPLVPSPDVLLADSKVPFVQSLYKCHTLLLDFHIKLPRPTPPRPENFFCDFKDTPAAAGYQRKLLLAINASRLKTLISLTPRLSSDRARFNSLSDKHSSSWLSTPPISPLFTLPDQSFAIASRLRLGLPPVEDLKHCICSASLISNPLHFLTCNLLRSSIISRHDRLFQCLARFARLTGTTVESEPHLAAGDEGSRADGKFYFTSLSNFVDLCVVHPAAASYLAVAVKPLGAASKREKDKSLLYERVAQSQGALFHPVYETFGALGSRGTMIEDQLNSYSYAVLYPSKYEYCDYVKWVSVIAS